MAIIARLEKAFLPAGAKSILSSNDFKRMMLTGYLSVICVATAIVYAWFDISSGVYYAIPNYIALFFLSLLALFLTRRGSYTPARIILMVSGNLVVFYSAINDPIEAGVFLLFLPSGIGSFAILGFQERNKSILLALFSLLLFILAFFTDLREWAGQTTSPEYARASFLINYVLSLLISVLIVYFLISLNQRAEESLMQKEQSVIMQNLQLEKENQELDRFVYSVSHDLRSPLSSILGLTNLTKLAATPEERQQYLEMIEGRIRVQDQFIHDIIEYSRNVRTHVSLVDIDLNALVAEVKENLQYHDGASRIKFICANDPLMIRSDLHRLKIILSNLIGNAIKYHDLKKAAPFIQVVGQLNGNNIHIEVVDNGQGIDPVYQPRVFEMFYRATELSKGSGLGLYITKEAVAKLGGRIMMESSLRAGSRFVVEIPNGAA